MTQRDLVDYAVQYRALPFEPLQIAARRRRVLAQVRATAPRRLLEVGCGEAPLFTDLPGTWCAVVEPAPAFAEGARRAAGSREDVVVVEDLAERVPVEAVGGPVDMVVVSCLLHEVPDPGSLLAAVRRFCGPRTVLHVNVPNSQSFHRLLAVAMGLVPSAKSTSDTQRQMQQRAVYDEAALEQELGDAGFAVRARGGILVKPFTHAQMQQLVDDGFLHDDLLAGLERLGEDLPGIASEIWMDAELRSE